MLCFCVMLFAYTSITLFDRTVAVRLLGLRIRIPPATCCELQGRRGPIPIPGSPTECVSCVIRYNNNPYTWKETGLKKLFESAVTASLLSVAQYLSPPCRDSVYTLRHFRDF